MKKASKVAQAKGEVKKTADKGKVKKTADKANAKVVKHTATELQKEYLLIRKNWQCGNRGGIVSSVTQDPEDCAGLIKLWGSKAFVRGTGPNEGKCAPTAMKVTPELWKNYGKLVSSAETPCPGGDWVKAENYDFYVFNPSFKPPVAFNLLLRRGRAK